MCANESEQADRRKNNLNKFMADKPRTIILATSILLGWLTMPIFLLLFTFAPYRTGLYLGKSLQFEDPIISILFLIAFISFYFLPTTTAIIRKHHNKTAIFVLNLLLGWLVLGWIGSLVWAFTNKK